MQRVDLNADLGESFGAYTLGLDGDILRYVTSANVACGLHAGDPMTMEKTVALCQERGVAIGAHPGYPDLQGFGRRSMGLTPKETAAFVLYQAGALQAFALAKGLTLQHIKLHGALYNTAAVSMEISEAVCLALHSANPDWVLLGLSGSCMLEAARRAGMPCAGEVFADRAYNDDGTLVSRRLPGAVLTDPGLVCERAVRMVREGTVESVNGKTIAVQADSICVHGDTPKALEFVRRIRESLEKEGIRVCPLGAV